MERFIGYFKLPFYHHTVEGRPLVFLLNGHNDNRTVDGIAALQAATQKELGVRKLNANMTSNIAAWTVSLSVGCLGVHSSHPSISLNHTCMWCVNRLLYRLHGPERVSAATFGLGLWLLPTLTLGR